MKTIAMISSKSGPRKKAVKCNHARKSEYGFGGRSRYSTMIPSESICRNMVSIKYA
jgi:hypothetical protein